jgi:hypothetical protein
VAGDPGFIVNAGLSDAWCKPQTAGQGFLIIAFPDAELLFLSWFTYETGLRPDVAPPFESGEPYLRWLTTIGGWAGARLGLDVTMTSGGLFDAASAITNTPPDSYGSIDIEFQGCNSATPTYDLFAVGKTGQIELTRITGDHVALCESFQQ